MRNAQTTQRSVLLVEADPDERERLVKPLEAAGFAVTVCGAPGGPDYRCIGGKTGDCPLVHEVDLIVFDAAIPGEEVLVGTPADELLALYVNSGRPVVAIGHQAGPIDRYADDGLTSLAREPSATSLVAEVRRLLRAAR